MELKSIAFLMALSIYDKFLTWRFYTVLLWRWGYLTLMIQDSSSPSS